MRRWLALALPMLWLGCDEGPASSDAGGPIELDRVGVVRALDMIVPRLGATPELLELRATRQALELQVVDGGSGRIVEYSCAFEPDGQPSPLVSGPVTLPLRGEGDLRENAFPLADLDLGRITAAFPLAKKAVDPSDGRVLQLVIRRYLPFSKGVRARIFVDSPRLAGSMDTNPHGIPIKP